MSKPEFISEVTSIMRTNKLRRMKEYGQMDQDQFETCAAAAAGLYWTLRQTRQAINEAVGYPEKTNHLLTLANSSAVQLVGAWLLDDSEAAQKIADFKGTAAELEDLVEHFSPQTMAGRQSPLTRGFIDSIYLLRLRIKADSQKELDNLKLAYCFHNIFGDGEAFLDERIEEMKQLQGTLFSGALASGILMAVPAVYFKLFTEVPVSGFEFVALGTKYANNTLKTSDRITVSEHVYPNTERVITGDDTPGSGTTLHALAKAMRQKYNTTVFSSY